MSKRDSKRIIEEDDNDDDKHDNVLFEEKAENKKILTKALEKSRQKVPKKGSMNRRASHPAKNSPKMKRSSLTKRAKSAPLTSKNGQKMLPEEDFEDFEKVIVGKELYTREYDGIKLNKRSCKIPKKNENVVHPKKKKMKNNMNKKNEKKEKKEKKKKPAKLIINIHNHASKEITNQALGIKSDAIPKHDSRLNHSLHKNEKEHDDNDHEDEDLSEDTLCKMNSEAYIAQKKLNAYNLFSNGDDEDGDDDIHV
jgi:hypothetical protein